MIKDYFTVKGSWRQRFFIYCMTFLLGLLFVWALDFVLNDICSFQKPEQKDFEKTYLAQSLVDRSKELQDSIDEKKASIERLNQQRVQLEESTKNAQISIKQMNDKQKLLLQNGKALSNEETEFNNKNMLLFQKNQQEDQKLAQTIIQLTSTLQTETVALKGVDDQLDKQREPATKAYDKAYQNQLVLEASVQIIFLLVVLAIAVYLLLRYRNTNYKMPVLAFFIASLYQMVLVVHTYFPSEYFKYILILALIVVIGKILVQCIKNAGSSQPEILLKRYRDAYTAFLCPNCEFPIRRGPMKYLYWDRRSLPRLSLSAGEECVEGASKEEAYTCPVCSTDLFSACSQCKEMRYSLLPSCPHCSFKEDKLD